MGGAAKVAGVGGVDIKVIIQKIYDVIEPRINAVRPATCDGAVLRMHYNWTFTVLFGSFLSVWYNWYYGDVIICASHFDANQKMKSGDDYINICLSYPYLVEGESSEDTEDKEPRRYILFYRWISWSLLVLAGIYWIPRKLSRTFENAGCQKLLEALTDTKKKEQKDQSGKGQKQQEDSVDNKKKDQSGKGQKQQEDSVDSKKKEQGAKSQKRLEDLADNNKEEQQVLKVKSYLTANLKTHNGLYWKFLGVNIIALVVDLFAMQFLDFILQGRFIQYGFKAYPFHRDPQSFTDYMSQTFPPFVFCELTNVHKLLAKRTEKYGCHLTIMELYEKLFLWLWLWLIVLMFITCCYILFLLCMWLPCTKLWLLRIAKPVHGSDNVRGMIRKAARNCKVGDVYLLYRIKGHVSHAKFYEVLIWLSEFSPKKQDSFPV